MLRFSPPLDACLREAASAKAGGRVSLPAGRQGWGWIYKKIPLRKRGM
jgi:hypothetical protein